ncbi:MAG: hypothetical protein IJK45_08745 [Bacteroidaceae bacterium]|nr:hypothetical protein [Bacteroidaceae bacterium]
MKKYCILCCIFALLAACSGIDYEQQLERFEEMNRTDVPMTPDSVQPLVRHYDHWWHSRNHRMRAYYMLGCAYRDQGSAPRALENYQRAVNVADTTDADCDLNVLMRVHSQMSQIFLLQRLPELEEQELHIAERLAWQIGDTLSALIFEEGLCNIYYNKREYNKCIKLSLLLQKEYNSSGYNNDAFIPLIYSVKSYMMMKEYTNAKHYLDIYERCPYFYSAPEKINGGLGALYIKKGQYFFAVHELDSAEYYFRKALPFEDIWDNRLLITEGLYQVYELKHNADSALKYTNLYSEAKQHSFNEARAEALTQAKAMYDYSVEKELAQKKAQTARRLVQSLVLIGLFVILISLYYLYRNEKRKREMSELREQYQQICNELKGKDEDIRELINRQDAGEELIEKYKYEKEELMIALARLDQTIKMKSNGDQKIDISKTTIVDRFKKYRNTRDKHYLILDEHWDELHNVIKKYNPTFYLRVNALQQLSINDYRVCMLVYAGFSSTDISALMNFSESAASNSRRRLNKKVFGVDGTPAEFDHKLRLL